MQKYNKFWDTLFDLEDWICFGAKPTDTRVYRDKTTWPQDAQFFAINALDSMDHAPTEVWHSHLRGRRADVNVTKFRSFLLEIDGMPLAEQMPYIQQSNLPFSTAVFSGGKSVHVIVALEKPLASRAEYDSAVRRLYKALPAVDQSAKNPSRFSRVPGARRSDNHVLQEMIAVHGRVPNNLFFDWLNEKSPTLKSETTEQGWVSLGINKWTRTFLLFGAPDRFWNNALFNAVCDLTRHGWPREQIIERCTQITGHLDATDMRTIDSAINTARREANDEAAIPSE